jgi:hypothetical protein
MIIAIRLIIHWKKGEAKYNIDEACEPCSNGHKNEMTPETRRCQISTEKRGLPNTTLMRPVNHAPTATRMR